MDFTRCAILIVAARFRGAGTMPLARPLIGRAARAGGADWPAQKCVRQRDLALPSVPGRTSYGKVLRPSRPYFRSSLVRADRVHGLDRPLALSLFLPSHLYPRVRHSPNFGRENTSHINRRHSRPPPIGLASAGEDRHLSESFPRGCHARPAFLLSFLPRVLSANDVLHVAVAVVLCERALCVP